MTPLLGALFASAATTLATVEGPAAWAQPKRKRAPKAKRKQRKAQRAARKAQR
jgi:hypothetical protein